MAVAAPAAAALASSAWAVPAIGAAAGAMIAKKRGGNPLQGALMGGLGGLGVGGLLGAGAGAAGAAGAANAAAAAGTAAGTGAAAAPGAAAMYGAALPGLTAEHAAMLAAQTGSMGTAGLGSTISSLGGSGGAGVGMFGNVMSNPHLASKVLGQAAQMQGGGGQRPMPVQQPMPMQPIANRTNYGSMQSRGQTGNMYQPRRTSLLG